MEDDLEVYPWWSDYLQHWDEGSLEETGLVHPPPAEGCPFKFLFDIM